MVMGFFPAPNVRMCWRRDRVYSMPNLALLMTRGHFEAIRQYFHTFNRKAIHMDNLDRLIVVRPIVTFFRERFRQVYTPECDLSLDEGLMPYKGCLSIKVYNPKKPSKYGIILYMICESKTGYVLDYITYEGLPSSLRDIVFELLEPHLGKVYHVFMDNYYNSVSLAEELYAYRVHCSGMLHLSRGDPPSLKALTVRKVQHNELHFRRRRTLFSSVGRTSG